MHIETIRGETRQAGGRHANARLRRNGLVPAIVYGHGEAPETVALSAHDLKLVLEHLVHVVKVDVSGKTRTFLLKDVQYDHLQADPVHVDLMRVATDDRVKIHVAIEPRGEPQGMHEGGVVQPVLTDLHVECPLTEIPDALQPNISHLHVGQVLRVADLVLPPGTKALHDDAEIVLSIKAKRGPVEGEEEAVEAAEGEEEAEPEVISRGKTDEESAEG